MNSPYHLRWRAEARIQPHEILERMAVRRRRFVRAAVDRELPYIVRYPLGHEWCGSRYPSPDEIGKEYRTTNAASVALIYFVEDESRTVIVVHVQGATMDAPAQSRLTPR